jgi:prepilin-type N-terminal cleavage/methylation domain-containing protein
MKNKAFSLIELSIVILIIGILVAGVTSSSRLIKRIKVVTAQNLTKGSPVSSIKDLSVWYESSLDESFVDSEESNGVNITSWFDINPQSSYRYPALQSTVANQPTYADDQINGLPAIKFNGSSSYFLTTDFNFANNKITIFIVTKRILGNDSGTAMLNGLNPSYGNDWADPGNLQVWEVSSQVKVWRGTPALSFINHPGNATPYIFSTTIDGANNITYLNGVSINTVATSGTILMKNLYMGCRYLGGPGIYYNGYISEVIIFSRSLSTEERKSIESYLGKKYSIKVS